MFVDSEIMKGDFWWSDCYTGMEYWRWPVDWTYHIWMPMICMYIIFKCDYFSFINIQLQFRRFCWLNQLSDRQLEPLNWNIWPVSCICSWLFFILILGGNVVDLLFYWFLCWIFSSILLISLLCIETVCIVWLPAPVDPSFLFYRKLLSSDRNPPIDDLIASGILPILVHCLTCIDK